MALNWHINHHQHLRRHTVLCLLRLPLLFIVFTLPALVFSLTFARQDQEARGLIISSKEKCRSNVCFNDGECFVSRGDKETKFFCECRSGFAGILCELPCNLQCLNGGKCNKTADIGEFCECPNDFHGPLCTEKVLNGDDKGTETVEVEDCRQRACPFAHVCLEDIESGDFLCERNLCLRLVGQTPCANNATCRPIKDDFVCECRAGFHGRRCADDIDECREANVGQSAEFVDASAAHATADAAANFLLRGPCQNGGLCVNMPGTFKCQCPPGYEGSICQTHIGTCAKSPCGDHGKCQDVDNNGNYKCKCVGNFTGQHCATECQPPRILAPNLNVTDDDAPNGVTMDCVCPAGKMGEHCELDLNPCAAAGGDATKTAYCKNGGQCVPAGTKTFCICPTGYSGPTCEQHEVVSSSTDAASDQSEQQQQCATVNGRKCQNGGHCVRQKQNGNLMSLCKCGRNFTGTFCERPLPRHKADTAILTINNMSSTTAMPPPLSTDLCSPNPCLNGGKCVPMENGLLCECPVGKFAGTRCQLKCHCLSDDEMCAESAVERGLVECYRPSQSPLTSAPPPQKHQNATKILPAGATPTDKALTSAEKDVEEKHHPAVADQADIEKATTSTTKSDRNDGAAETDQPDQEEEEESDEQHFGTFAEWATNNNETAVSNCTQCANSAKCVRVAHRIGCLCGANFVGTLCDIEKPICASLKCHKPGELCQPIRGMPHRKDEARCECPPGMDGKSCSQPNTLSFTNSSVVLLQSAAVRNNKHYFLNFGIRTTLQTAHLASGENLRGQTEFTIQLHDGILLVHVGANGNSDSEQFTNRLEVPVHVNDDDWYLLKLWSTRKSGTIFELWHSETGYLLSRNQLSADHKLAPILTTRLGQQRGAIVPPFVGCMRAVSLNGAEPVGADDPVRAINVQPGCHRHAQCETRRDTPARCANGGVCVDRWDTFVCQCPRPFLAPNCAEQSPEATFGHNDQPSNCLALNADDKTLVAEKTQISFLLRTVLARGGGDLRGGVPGGDGFQLTATAPAATSNTAAMPLFYIGETAVGSAGGGISATTAEPEETSTFIAAQLRGGVPRVSARLGGKQVYAVDAQERVDDGKVHLLELNRDGNLIKMKVDDGKWHSVRIGRSFEHPLLADQLIVGAAVPPSNFPIGAFAGGNNSSDHFFKGTLQDFRVNDRLVPFFNDFEQKLLHQPSSVAVPPLFAHKLSDQNLLQGTVSDDVCTKMATSQQRPPCGQHGKCVNIFNSFECNCSDGWLGQWCEQRDFCGHTMNGTTTTKFCPEGTECQNLDGAFVCTSTASLFASSSLLRYAMRQFDATNIANKNMKPPIGNFTMELRTRSRNGHLLKLQSSNAAVTMLLLQLKNGVLQISSSANDGPNVAAVVGAKNITDGQWHQLMLVSQNAKSKSAIILHIDGATVRLSSAINFSLADFVTDKLARITVGRVPDQEGFKGCLRNVQFAHLPPLIFHSLQKVPKMAEAMATARITHFELQRQENVVPNGCQSSNVCAKNPCLNGGTCEDMWNAMRCQCAPGFEGENCEINRDECESQDGHATCAPNGKCVDAPNGFRCACADGFSGPKCSHAEELCRAGLCKNGAKCQTVNGTAECECGPKLIGTWCQLEAGTKCSEEPCQNGGRCFQSAHGEISCRCKHGFTGSLCELRVDPCSRSQPCANGGKCVPSPAASALSLMIGGGANAAAMANKSRSTTTAPFHCECAREFESALCERLADACARLGPPREACAWHGKCENVWGGHRCVCDNGWRGRDCSIRIDECAEESPCVNGGTCHQPHQLSPSNGTGARFHCHCPPFYRGDRCELAGACADNPCEHEGECVQLEHDAAGDADDASANFVCRCKRTFRGIRCEQRVDVCQEQEPCQNGGTCVPFQSDDNNNNDDFRCTCISGFTGKKCEMDIDECAAKPCLHGGRCVDRVNSFQCYCNGTGYTGHRCEQDIDECAAAAGVGGDAHLCLNGACTNLDGDYQCECKSGYIGKRCHMANPCVPNPLTNRTRHNCAHGRCVRPQVRQASSGVEFVQHECECQEGFTGELCMHLVEAQHQLSMANFVGAGVVLVVLTICLCALLYFFAACARRKRAFQGTYSPSNQELAAETRVLSQRQFQRQPLHRNQLSMSSSGGGGFVHKTRRKY